MASLLLTNKLLSEQPVANWDDNFKIIIDAGEACAKYESKDKMDLLNVFQDGFKQCVIVSTHKLKKRKQI